MDKFYLLKVPGVTQTCYTDDAISLGMLVIFEACFHSLERGYYPKPSKIVLIVHPDNLEARKLFGARHGFKVCMGEHYLGGYIGDDESKQDCMKYHTAAW